jgi:zinc-ribbon family
MIILFGIRRKASRLGVVFMMCSSCHTPAAHALTRVRKYFTLFFIPIIPLGDKYATSCTMCGYGMRITKEQATQYLATVEQPAPPPGAAPAVIEGADAAPAAAAAPAVAAATPPIVSDGTPVAEPIDPASAP